jgi:hypothetical protein
MSNGLTIQQGGYTSFDESPSDQRWLWFDIDERYLIGQGNNDTNSTVKRRATSKIPSIKTKFNHLLNVQMKKYSLKTKVETLVDDCQQQMKTAAHIDEHLRRRIDRIYDLISRSVGYADRRCIKVRNGTVPFSPKYKETKGAVRIVKLLIRRWEECGRKHRPRMRRIRRLMTKYNYTGPAIFSTLEDLKEYKQRVLQIYKQTVQQADNLRESYLGKIAAERSELDGLTFEHHLHQLILQEDIK